MFCGVAAVEIYLDVLILENIVINYLILLVTSKISKRKVSSLRLLVGSFVGAIYVVPALVFPSAKTYYTIIAKFLLSVLIIAVTFAPEKISAFIKTLALFYVSSFMFAGAVLAILLLNNNGGFIKDGLFYVLWQPQWTVVALAVITIGIVIRICWGFIQQKFAKENLLVKLIIAFENKTVNIDALIDTGNSLHDPLSNMPVVVVEFIAIKDILPQEICNIFEQSREDDLLSVTDIISGSKWFSRFRLIPFTSLGKENGMLIGFKPDYIKVMEKEENKGICDVIVGICNKALSRNEKYKALLNPELI